MQTLDEKLKGIRKIDVSDEEIYRQARQIRSRVKKPKQSFVPVVVTCVMFAILCLLIFMPPAKLDTPQQAMSLEELEIKEWIVLNNERPKRVFNLDSANYFTRHVANEPLATERMHRFLMDITTRSVPWDEAYKNDYSVYDIKINFTNGQSIYYKYSSSELYDVTNKVKYDLMDDQRIEFISFIIDERNESRASFGIIFCIFAVIMAIIFTFDWMYRKNYAALDERGAQKKLPYWISFICNLLFLAPIPLMNIIIGTVHIGLICIMIVLYVFIHSQLEIKLGVIRPNNIHYKFFLPVYITLLIIAVIIITVV